MDFLKDPSTLFAVTCPACSTFSFNIEVCTGCRFKFPPSFITVNAISKSGKGIKVTELNDSLLSQYPTIRTIVQEKTGVILKDSDFCAIKKRNTSPPESSKNSTPTPASPGSVHTEVSGVKSSEKIECMQTEQNNESQNKNTSLHKFSISYLLQKSPERVEDMSIDFAKSESRNENVDKFLPDTEQMDVVDHTKEELQNVKSDEISVSLKKSPHMEHMDVDSEMKPQDANADKASFSSSKTDETPIIDLTGEGSQCEDEEIDVVLRYRGCESGKLGDIEIQDYDVNLLRPGKWLNDKILDFYLEYIYHEKFGHFKEKFHIFRSLFYSELYNFNKVNKETWKSESEEMNDTVKFAEKRGVSGTDLSKDFFFVPVNWAEGPHWFLIVVCFIGEILQQEKTNKTSNADDGDNCVESMKESSGKIKYPYAQKGKPCICIFDSCQKYFKNDADYKKFKHQVKENLKQFFKMLWKSQNPNKEFDWNNMTSVEVSCPQQTNDKDCGLYLLQYVESFFEIPITKFENPMPDLSDWFHTEIVEGKNPREIFEIGKVIDGSFESSIMNDRTCKRAKVKDVLDAKIEEIKNNLKNMTDSKDKGTKDNLNKRSMNDANIKESKKKMGLRLQKD